MVGNEAQQGALRAYLYAYEYSYTTTGRMPQRRERGERIRG